MTEPSNDLHTRLLAVAKAQAPVVWTDVRETIAIVRDDLAEQNKTLSRALFDLNNIIPLGAQFTRSRRESATASGYFLDDPVSDLQSLKSKAQQTIKLADLLLALLPPAEE